MIKSLEEFHNKIDKHNENNFMKNSFVIFDLETCDNNKSIIEIGAIKINNGEIVEQFNELVKPKNFEINKWERFNNIPTKLVKEKGRDTKAVLEEFNAFIGDLDLYAHNGETFDFVALKRAYNQVELPFPTNNFIDTKDFFQNRSFYLWQSEKWSLQFLSSMLGVDYLKAHRSVQDCKILYEVYLKIQDKKYILNSFKKRITPL
ncbi:3'-5' exonuclease [Mycoplasma sp. Z386]